MGFLIDSSSKKIFQTDHDSIIEEPLPQSNLILWYSQFLKSSSNFIEINPRDEYCSIILSSFCKNVFLCSDSDDTRVIDKIKTSMSLNKTFNIDTLNDIHDINNLDSISLIKFNDIPNLINVFDTIKNGLERNSFPTLIFQSPSNIENLSNCVKILGYDFNQVAWVDNVYIASNHKIISSNKKELKEIIQMMEQGHHDQVYEKAKSILFSGQLDGMVKATLLHNLTISSYYVSKFDEGRKFCEELILMPNIEYKMRNNCLMNLQFYIKPIKFTKKISINIPEARNLGFVETTPTIFKLDHGYKCIVRTVNYKLDEHGNFLIRNDDNLRRTENYVIIYDNDWNILTTTKITGHGNARLFPNDFIGLEDIKLFKENEFFCTSTEIHPTNVPQMCYGEINENSSVINLNHIKVSNFINCEKNWLPFHLDDETYFIYKIAPLRIYKLNNGSITLIKSFEFENLDISGFRGSAPPIEFDNGLLFTIHQIYDAPLRKYYHRFVWIDKNFTLLKFSDLFYFDTIGIEFNLGLSLVDNNQLVIGFSINDAESYIGIINSENIIYTHQINL